MTLDSYKKVEKWIDQLNEETGDPKNFPTKISFARAYIKNSYNFVVKNFSCIHGLKRYLSQFSGQLYEQKYNEHANMDRMIQEKVGVCAQFASLLCILTASDQSTLQKTKMSVSPSLLACKVKLENGKFDGHCLNTYNFYGKIYFCDPTMQSSFKNHDFLLKTKQELQKEYYDAEKSQIVGRASNIEIKERKLSQVCKIISDFNFITDTTTKDYRATSLFF